MSIGVSRIIPRLGPDVEIVAALSGELVLRARGQFAVVDGMRGADLKAVLSEVDAGRTAREITAALPDDDGRRVRAVLRAFERLMSMVSTDAVFQPSVVMTHARASESPVVVVGNGRLSARIAEALCLHEFAAVRHLHAHAFTSCHDRRFRHARQTRVLARHSATAADGDRTGDAHSVEGLSKEFAGARLVVCALEGMFLRAVLDVNAACIAARVPAIFVTVDADSVRLGPTYIPGHSACFECVYAAAADPIRASLELFTTYMVTADEALERVVQLIALEGHAVTTGSIPPQLVTRVASVPRGAPLAPLTQRPVMPRSAVSCGCSAATAEHLDQNLRAIADISLMNSGAYDPCISVGFEDVPDPYRTVGVIGGGTAGYFAALAIQAKLPHLDVTLVQSSRIPIIGVGESTTPDIVYFLHGDLGFDLYDFYCRVRPTWKMGIRFFWGKPGEYYFNEPFAPSRHSEALHYDGDLNTSSFASRLMSRELGPMLETDAGPLFLLDCLTELHAAYHLDNKRFVSFLAEEAKKRRIRHIDAEVTAAVKTADGEDVDFLLTADGRRLKFDLFIDCTGFRSALLEREMGSRFVSFDRSLFTDTAIVAEVPNGGHLKPYTLAESMDCGWCWNIPQEESDHRGYVFSSRFCTVEEAAAEMRRKNPGMSDYRTVKFRSGRHDEFWKGNVIGIGNAYGFVEPLESTAIQVVIIELQTLIRNFPTRRSERLQKKVITSKVAAAWDYIRWFLSIHYRFNRKVSSPFWDACRRDVDISGMADLVGLFKERAPLATRSDADLIRTRLTSEDLTFNVALVDSMLLGQGVPTARLDPPAETQTAWRRRALAAERLLGQAVSQRRALEILRERPEILGLIKIPAVI